MKKIAIFDAIGKTICHDMTAIDHDGTKTVRFKRGTVIRAEDLPVLQDMGKNHIFIWEADKCEVHEEDAAQALKEVLCTQDFYASPVKEGKITLFAAHDGLFVVNEAAVKSINHVPDFSLLCIGNAMAVKKDDPLIAFRIIPLVTQEEHVKKACFLAENFAPLFHIRPYVHKTCAVIITGNEIAEKRIPDAFEPIIRKKLRHFPATIDQVHVCKDDEAELLTALTSAEHCDLIFITGGMSVDPDDITVETIKKSGATFIIRGMHIQPGNMLSLAQRKIHGKMQQIVGVPGASIHSPITSLDMLLPRLFANLPFTDDELDACAIGGMLGKGKNYYE